MAAKLLGCCTPAYNGTFYGDGYGNRRGEIGGSDILCATVRFSRMPLFDHAFRVFSRLLPVPPAFFAIGGASVIRTGLGLFIFVWSTHLSISTFKKT
ncbi:hypothetical protein [Agrobacterium tumefaciens]|uniref:hypothetical protein n=1 Tax=Agrobacterium tumefaciens TaxID=358 RepID=UPI001571A1EF|nr:hypothetical protein [Agrobacterium tumefaciens]WCJ64169.1 hypothetical protein G6M15_14730 [Agrobacterium tumefaciens]